jgi:hypothetical protein
VGECGREEKKKDGERLIVGPCEGYGIYVFFIRSKI